MCLKREHKLWQYCLAKKGEGDNHSYLCSEEAIKFPGDMYIPGYFSKCSHSIVSNPIVGQQWHFYLYSPFSPVEH